MSAADKKRLPGYVFIALLAGFAALNGAARSHAYHMVHFAAAGLARTPHADTMTWSQKALVLFTGVTLPRPVARRTPADLGLAYETLRLTSGPTMTLEAWRISLKDSRGLAVLLHGYAGEKSQLLDEAAALRAFGYEALLVDFRGVGGSDGTETTVGWLEAEDAAAAIAFARGLAGAKPVVVYATSMGAAAALRAAGPLGARPDAMVLESVYDTLRRTTGRRFLVMGAPAWPFTDLLLFWGGLHAGFKPSELEPVRFAPLVRCPVLLLHGSHDRYVAVEDAKAVAAALGGRGRLALFESSGHGRFLRSEPVLWGETLREFLAALQAPARMSQ